MSGQPDGSLRVTAKGTDLNPGAGFEFTATGGPETYAATGRMTAFDDCIGKFTAQLVRQDIRGVSWYVADYTSGAGGKTSCQVMIREALR